MTSGRTSHEAHLPAEQPATAQEARIPSAHAHPCRPVHSVFSPQQRPLPPNGLNVLPRDQRLHPRSQVRDTIRRGRRVRAGCVVVHHVSDGDQPRAAVVAGKGLGNAVARHRRQRQLRHALAGMWHELPGGSWVIRALPGDGDPVVDLRRAVQRI